MYYRWGPYFEMDCKNHEYVKQLKELDAYQLQLREQREEALREGPQGFTAEEREAIEECETPFVFDAPIVTQL